MDVAPYENSKPIYYKFTACPAAEFAKQFGFADIMPALCEDLKPYITCKRQAEKVAVRHGGDGGHFGSAGDHHDDIYSLKRGYL